MQIQRIKKLDFIEKVWKAENGYLIKREYRQIINDRIDGYNNSKYDVEWFVVKGLHGEQKELRVNSKSEGLRMLNYI